MRRAAASALGKLAGCACIGHWVPTLCELTRDPHPQAQHYIEYWGLDTTDYKMGMLLKQKLYQQQGKRLV